MKIHTYKSQEQVWLKTGDVWQGCLQKLIDFFKALKIPHNSQMPERLFTSTKKCVLWQCWTSGNVLTDAMKKAILGKQKMGSGSHHCPKNAKQQVVKVK